MRSRRASHPQQYGQGSHLFVFCLKTGTINAVVHSCKNRNDGDGVRGPVAKNMGPDRHWTVTSQILTGPGLTYKLYHQIGPDTGPKGNNHYGPDCDWSSVCRTGPSPTDSFSISTGPGMHWCLVRSGVVVRYNRRSGEEPYYFFFSATLTSLPFCPV